MFNDIKPSLDKDSQFGRVVGLLGHLSSSGAVLIFFTVFAWLLAVCVYLLDKAHPFNGDTRYLVEKMELYLLYVDASLCVAVLISGAARFCHESLRRKL